MSIRISVPMLYITFYGQRGTTPGPTGPTPGPTPVPKKSVPDTNYSSTNTARTPQAALVWGNILCIEGFRNHGITSIFVRKITYLWHYQVKNMPQKSCDFVTKGTKGSRTGSVLELFLVVAFDKFNIWTVLTSLRYFQSYNLSSLLIF